MCGQPVLYLVNAAFAGDPRFSHRFCKFRTTSARGAPRCARCVYCFAFRVSEGSPCAAETALSDRRVGCRAGVLCLRLLRALPRIHSTISKETAVFEGRAYVLAKGKRTAKLSSRQFETFLHAWYDGNFYAMRDDYCDVHCPDGTVIFVTDIAGSSITLTTPTFKKRVYECFSTVNHQPQTPKPPEQYFQLSQRLLAFANSQHWL